MNLPDRIRQALAPAHAEVERTPFAQGMASGRIGRAEYAAGLRQLGHLHAALEAALAASAPRHPALAALYDPARMDRSSAIVRDRIALGADGADPAKEPVKRLTDRIAEWAALAPWALLGPLYVVEGSRMGSMFLTRSLGRALGVDPLRPDSGLDYHAEGLATRAQDWKRFRQGLADAPLTESEADDVLRAAGAAMEGLVEMYAGLPTGSTPSDPAGSAL